MGSRIVLMQAFGQSLRTRPKSEPWRMDHGGQFASQSFGHGKGLQRLESVRGVRIWPPLEKGDH